MQLMSEGSLSPPIVSARTLETAFWFAIATHVFTVWSTIVRYSGYEIAKSYLADDTFYYLVIANNIAQGFGSTFDGESHTNGYHPLWLVVCVAVAKFIPHELQIEFLYGLQGILVAGTAILVKSALSRIDQLAAVIASGLLVISGAIRFVLMNGMESALGGLLLAALLHIALRDPAGKISLKSTWDRSLSVALLAALALTRLEMAVVAVAYLAIALHGSGSPQERRGVYWVAGCLALTGLCYIAANMMLTGWPVPISGSVKWAGTETTDVLMHTARIHLNSFLRPLTPVGSLPTYAALVAAAVMLAALITRSFANSRVRLAALLVCAPCAIFAAVAISRSGGFAWYGWPALLAGTVCTFALVSAIHIFVISKWRPLGGVGFSAASAVILCLLSAALCYSRYSKERSTVLYDWDAPEVLMDGAITYIKQHVPTEQKISGTSVGLLSFMSRRAIVQTEGLVNDLEYFLALQQGRASEVLRSRGVRWFFAIVHHRDRSFPEFFDEADVFDRRFLSREIDGIPQDAPDDVQIIRFDWRDPS